MTDQRMPQRITREVSVQQIGRETLVYDGVRHRAFCLNESSGVVWRLANGTHTVAEIVAAASAELGTDVSEQLVQIVLNALHSDGLIEASWESEVQRSLSRRVMLQQLGTGGALLLPVIAAIAAPTAAQAYSGCVDCDTSQVRAARARRAQRSGAAGAPAGKPLD
ncbi:MAG TPA: PqqD family protein [Acidobacteriaceae bacterium]|nr:PqqD family protein [Acidobacteriaceae bacterium]